MHEHATQAGSLATSAFKYKKLVALYCIGDAQDISKSERLIRENELTLQLKKLQDNPYRVRGGSWTTHGIIKDYNPPIEKLKKTCMPVICYCKVPAKKNFNKYVCGLTDAKWIQNLDNDKWPLSSIEICAFNVNEIDAKIEDEPNFCSMCEIPCGKFLTCFPCKK
jgi:hypothetical protein